MTKTDIMQVLEAIIERDKADGCHGCAFESTEPWDMPCRECRRNQRDYWRMAEVSE